MEWAPKPRTYKIWYKGARLTVRDFRLTSRQNHKVAELRNFPSLDWRRQSRRAAFETRRFWATSRSCSRLGWDISRS